MLSDETQRFTSLPERGNENIQYLIPSSRNRTHILWSLQLHACASACSIKNNNKKSTVLFKNTDIQKQYNLNTFSFHF